uniref:Exoribonuclease phosphorolytic domain-containing protein n=1 Tax=Oryza meridionalis TaxID=40149 RepID=A0A0E0F528_9ORYZ
MAVSGIRILSKKFTPLLCRSSVARTGMALTKTNHMSTPFVDSLNGAKRPFSSSSIIEDRHLFRQSWYPWPPVPNIEEEFTRQWRIRFLANFLFLVYSSGFIAHKLEIPLVSVGDDGRVFTVGGNEGKAKYELVNREKRKLTIANVPFSLTCALHKGNVLADPTAEEESIIETSVTIVLDSSDQIVSIQKPGGAVTSMTTIKECISLAKDGRRKLREILMDSVEAMEVDQTD